MAFPSKELHGFGHLKGEAAMGASRRSSGAPVYWEFAPVTVLAIASQFKPAFAEAYFEEVSDSTLFKSCRNQTELVVLVNYRTAVLCYLQQHFVGPAPFHLLLDALKLVARMKEEGPKAERRPNASPGYHIGGTCVAKALGWLLEVPDEDPPRIVLNQDMFLGWCPPLRRLPESEATGPYGLDYIEGLATGKIASCEDFIRWGGASSRGASNEKPSPTAEPRCT